MKKIISLICAILLLLNFVGCDSSDKSELITFPDKNLEQAVRDTIGKPKGNITKGDVKRINTLYVFDKKISNLSGIENLSHLTSLNLSFNQISNIEPLKGLTKLTYLWLKGNQINDIGSLKELTHLTSLELENNQINNLEPLKNLTRMSDFRLRNNKINDIEALKGLNKIYSLDLAHNNITSIKALKGKENMNNLHLGFNQIKDYSPASSYYLKLQSKDFTIVDTRADTTVITFPDKNLEQLIRDTIKKPTGDIIKGDVMEISDLNASRKNISNITGIENLANLVALYFECNEISNIEPLKNMPCLQVLFLNDNKITDFSPVSPYYKRLKVKDFKLPVIKS